MAGSHEIEVIDLMEDPRLAREDQVFAVPAVVRLHPVPRRTITGDLADLTAADLGAGTIRTLASEQQESSAGIRGRMEQAEGALLALRAGHVDALLIQGPRGERLVTLEAADHPYRALVSSMPEGAASLSCDHVVLYANETLARMLAVSVGDLVGEQFERFLAPAGAIEFETVLRAAARGPAHCELQVTRADGSAFPARVSLAPLPPAADSMRALVLSDLSERTQHERDERTLEQVALAIGTAGGIAPALQAVLRVVCSKLGWPQGEAWLGEEDDAGFECVVRHGRAPPRAWAEPVSRVHEDIARVLGSRRPAWSTSPAGGTVSLRTVSIPAVVDGEVVCVLRFLAPASPTREDERAARLVFAAARQLASFIGRRRTETKLAATSGVLRHAEAISGLGGWEYDATEDRHNWTEQVYRIFGLDPATHDAGDLAATLSLFEPDSAATLGAAFSRAVHAGEPYDLELAIVRADGRRAWVRAVGQPAFRAGRVSGVRGFVADVTDLNEARELVLRANAELEQRVAARTAELHYANRELEAFSYSVSHDLRAPLRAVDGFSHALERRFGDGLGEEGGDMIARIVAGVTKMGALIDAMLALSRLSSCDLRRETVDLASLARDIVQDLRAAEPEREVDISLDASMPVRGDPELLRTVLANLLGNAWKFTRATDRARIEMTGTGANGREFVVRDNGAGFDMAYADHLFRPFRRLHRDEEFPGTGIGLVTVQRIINRHGGTIRGEGSVGEGAAFYFDVGAE